MGKPFTGRAAAFFVCVVIASGLAPPASAEDAMPPYFAVTGVPAGDVLNMRDVPHGDSKKLGAIPPGERGLKNLGCLRPEPSLDRWLTMTEDERKNAKLEWCRVEYHGKQGWVAARFLTPDK
ncbi:MAG: SH3 domain-containing protein [Hyphomicrobium sp.]|uniref:SH3 domain-containing protein n=1 Tax=Hyphomicrobium sp. TaxID=82 RepID=UPI003D0BE631